MKALSLPNTRAYETDTIDTITVKTRFAGIHRYPDAPMEVDFLRHPHRHDFHVEVTIEVFHDDREIEFFMLKTRVDDYLKLYEEYNRGSCGSCETIARSLFTAIRMAPWGKVPHLDSFRKLSVSVFEDGENGATINCKEYITG